MSGDLSCGNPGQVEQGKENKEGRKKEEGGECISEGIRECRPDGGRMGDQAVMCGIKAEPHTCPGC